MALGAFHVFRENVFQRTRDFAGPVSLKGNLGYGDQSLHKFETACLSEHFFSRETPRKVRPKGRNDGEKSKLLAQSAADVGGLFARGHHR